MNKIINLIWCSICCALVFTNAKQLGVDFSFSNFPQNATSVTTATLNSIHFSNNNGVAVSTNETIIHTTNSGNTWQGIASGGNNSLTDICFLNATTGWTSECSSNLNVRLLYVSKPTNGSINWLSYSALPTPAYANTINILKYNDAICTLNAIMVGQNLILSGNDATNSTQRASTTTSTQPMIAGIISTYSVHLKCETFALISSISSTKIES